MNCISKHILRLILSSLFCIIAYILLTGLLQYEKVIFLYNPIFLAIGIGIYIFLIMFFYKTLLKRIEKIKYIEYFLFAVFLILCIISALYFKVNPTWDMGTTFDIAKEYVECRYIYKYILSITIS